jgi:hypothetical protein
MSATRRVFWSHETPNQLWQQSVPVHDLNMAVLGSRSDDLKAFSAASSDGRHELTVVVTANSNSAVSGVK